MDAVKTGDFIRELRMEKEITQKQLAEKLHVSNAAVSKWENGHGFPDISSLEELSSVLDISITELIRGERREECEERIISSEISEEQNAIVKEIIQLSELEIKEKNKSMKKLFGWLILCIAVIGFILLYYIWSTQNRPILDVSRKMGLFVFLPLGFGLAAWIIGAAMYFFGENMERGRQGFWHAISFLCCAIAMWFPILEVDLRIRNQDAAALYDLSAFYNYTSLFLLIVTILINGCGYKNNHFSEK